MRAHILPFTESTSSSAQKRQFVCEVPAGYWIHSISINSNNPFTSDDFTFVSMKTSYKSVTFPWHGVMLCNLFKIRTATTVEMPVHFRCGGWWLTDHVIEIDIYPTDADTHPTLEVNACAVLIENHVNINDSSANDPIIVESVLWNLWNATDDGWFTTKLVSIPKPTIDKLIVRQSLDRLESMCPITQDDFILKNCSVEYIADTFFEDCRYCLFDLKTFGNAKIALAESIDAKFVIITDNTEEYCEHGYKNGNGCEYCT